MLMLLQRFATVAQLVEQLIRNQQVAGSSPASSSTKKKKDFFPSSFFSRFSFTIYISFLYKHFIRSLLYRISVFLSIISLDITKKS